MLHQSVTETTFATISDRRNSAPIRDRNKFAPTSDRRNFARIGDNQSATGITAYMRKKGKPFNTREKNVSPTSTLLPSFPLVRRCIPAVPVSATKLRLPLRLTRVFRLLSHTCPQACHVSEACKKNDYRTPQD